MKKILISCACCLILTTPVIAKENALIQSQNRMDHSMMAMQGMHQLKLTGDPDVDFLTGMIPHHDGAIVMSQMSMEKLTDPKLKKLAKEIIAAQEQEIAFMKDWLKQNKTRPLHINMKASENMMNKTMKVMHEMHQVKLTGDANTDFALGMIPHHQAAVVMAEQALPYLTDPKTKQFAEQVIKMQEAEIKLMMNVLATNNAD